MSEIEKMYENAGFIQKRCKDYSCIVCDKNKDCDKYPHFTAEKQLAIFKMFCIRYLEVSQHVEENGDLCFGIKATVGDFAAAFDKDFAECLASFVNQLWQDLTEEEKQQVKGILE